MTEENHSDADVFDAKLRQAMQPNLPSEADARIRSKLATLPVPADQPAWLTSADKTASTRTWWSRYAWPIAAAVFLIVALVGWVRLLTREPITAPNTALPKTHVPDPPVLPKSPGAQPLTAPQRPPIVAHDPRSSNEAVLGEKSGHPLLPRLPGEKRYSPTPPSAGDSAAQLREHASRLAAELKTAVEQGDYARARELSRQIETLLSAVEGAPAQPEPNNKENKDTKATKPHE